MRRVCFLIVLMGVMIQIKEGEAAGRGGGRGQWQSLVEKACDEIYVVGEGESLHSISDKCADPYILHRNPHIQDPDDVFPGLLIKIVPSSTS